MRSTGPTLVIQLNHNESIIRDSVSGAGWRDQYHIVTTDESGDATIETDMSKITFASCSLISDAAGTLPAAIDLGGISLDDDSGRYEIPFIGDASSTYHVRLIGNYEGR
ncbi:MAG: hypothetical protein IH600_15085 [Bacteroidetes bacterium]|nr:hypothetical protein [Bacteroidota bacterium]